MSASKKLKDIAIFALMVFYGESKILIGIKLNEMFLIQNSATRV